MANESSRAIPSDNRDVFIFCVCSMAEGILIFVMSVLFRFPILSKSTFTTFRNVVWSFSHILILIIWFKVRFTCSINHTNLISATPAAKFDSMAIKTFHCFLCSLPVFNWLIYDLWAHERTDHWSGISRLALITQKRILKFSGLLEPPCHRICICRTNCWNRWHFNCRFLSQMLK